MGSTYKYEVAFSFAGEDRDYVKKVATFLKEQKISVFYDDFEEDNLWGKNLVPLLEKIYTYESRYCVIFISKYYIQKQWTCYESASAMCRMLENNTKGKEYLLPVKFDDTKVPGVLSTLGFVDGKKKTPEELGRLIIKKINAETNNSQPLLTIKEFKKHIVEILTTNFPNHWKVVCSESSEKINIKYSFGDFEYFLKILLDVDGQTLLINGEYTDAFFDTHILIPSAKIILNLSEEIVTNAKIVNFDFFDYMNHEVSSPLSVIEEIKKEILNKGER